MATQTLDTAGTAAVTQGSRFSAGRILLTVVLVVALIFYLIPIYVMIVTALKHAAQITGSTTWTLPAAASGEGFRMAWDALSPNMATSFELVIPATIISALFGALNGYLFSKWRFKGSDVIFTLVLFGMFIPYQSILIPLIQFLQKIHLYGTLPGLIVVHIVYGLPITTLIFRNYFTNIPSELIEAARVDGAGLIQVFRQIMLPLAIPAFVVVGIFQFTNIWNDFLFGLTIITDPNHQPITVALNNLSGSGSVTVQWNVVMAGAVIAALPTAILYVLLGRFFIKGMLSGSMKG